MQMVILSGIVIVLSIFLYVQYIKFQVSAPMAIGPLEYTW